MDLVLSQARWFEIPLLDEGGCQPCFVFPHKKERKTHRFGVEKVVELGDHGVQNLVLHKEDHGFHGKCLVVLVNLFDGKISGISRIL